MASLFWHGGFGNALRGPNRSLLEAFPMSKQFANLSHAFDCPLQIVFVHVNLALVARRGSSGGAINASKAPGGAVSDFFRSRV
jgi:hypothetical protein